MNLSDAADAARRMAPSGLKGRLFDAITSPAVGALVRRAFPRGIPHHGCRIVLRGPQDDRSAAKLLFRLYERAEIALIHRFLPTDADVVEIGGSLGVTTCQIARKLGGSRRVVTVEADPVLARHISDTVSLNRLDNVEVVARALHYGGPTVAFAADHSLAGRTGSEGATVPAVTLSGLLADHGIGEYALVMDAEGAEIPMLLHDVPALARCRMILIEMDGGEYGGIHYGPDDVAKLILGAGFSQKHRHGPVAAFVRAA